MFFLAVNVSVAAELNVGVQARHVEGANNDFLRSQGFQRVGFHRIELYGAIFCFLNHFLKSNLQLLTLFSRTLQLCFTVKLQKCFVSYDTSPAAVHRDRGWRHQSSLRRTRLGVCLHPSQAHLWRVVLEVNINLHATFCFGSCTLYIPQADLR